RHAVAPYRRLAQAVTPRVGRRQPRHCQQPLQQRLVLGGEGDRGPVVERGGQCLLDRRGRHAGGRRRRRPVQDRHPGGRERLGVLALRRGVVELVIDQRGRIEADLFELQGQPPFRVVLGQGALLRLQFLPPGTGDELGDLVGNRFAALERELSLVQ